MSIYAIIWGYLNAHISSQFPIVHQKESSQARQRYKSNAVAPNQNHWFPLMALQNIDILLIGHLFYKNPLVPLTFRAGFASASPDPDPEPCLCLFKPMELPRLLLSSPLSLNGPGRTKVPLRLRLSLSIRNPLHPSSSRSIRSARSRSSRRSRSARLAKSWLALSEDWSSSMVVSSAEILSRALLRSSVKEPLSFSRRSICDWRSLTVRSTLRMLRASAVFLLSAASSCLSSCFCLC